MGAFDGLRIPYDYTCSPSKKPTAYKPRERRTYDEWQERGKQVIKGQKAVGFNEKGKALFSSEQVYAIVTARSTQHDHSRRMAY